ncbi:MAG TPA: dehydrogenase [Cryomorphaceae bacterium]|nr:dehydrogenase [Cryomorphaceae bacterium]
MRFQRKGLTNDELIHFYRAILKPRLIEEKMLIALRQGRISKWFSGYGQEAISVGATLALEEDEYILPMHRNLGIFTSRNVPLDRLFSQFQGKANGFTKGRDRSFHFGTNEHHLVGMISHLGPQMGIADGIALATKLKKENKATLVITGDGGASEGDFHEAINVAAVWDLPVIFLVENNQWGLSTPSEEQFRFKSFVYKAIGYGIKGNSIDGNNILEVYHEVKKIAEEMRSNPGPFLLECRTFRMRGHEEASGTKYYPEGLQDKWSKKDPVDNYRAFLINKGILSPEMNEEIVEEIKKEISTAFESALAEEPISFSAETELGDRFAAFEQEAVAPAEEQTEMRMVDAISNGLKEAMHKFPELVIMGQDIAEYGGVFKVTDGFINQFGKERVRNTPLCEAAIVGSALGLSVKGYKSVVEMQFADFVSVGFNQIVNNLAKTYYRWRQPINVTLRLPTGGGIGAGPFHSQSNESWFFHVPGLKLVYPSNPIDAKGLLLSSIDDENPVLFFEHKALYRSIKADVQKDNYHIPIGKAKKITDGSSLTVVTYGMGVIWMKDYLENNSEYQGLVEIIDLRSLLPWDKDMVFDSVKKTNKVIILNEDNITGSISAEISAVISEFLFEYLDAPIVRLGAIDTPIPFSANIEKNIYLPTKKINQAIKKLLEY